MRITAGRRARVAAQLILAAVLLPWALPAQAHPAPARMDTAALGVAYRRAAGLPRLRSLLVWQDGRLLRERYFNGARATGRANIKSASKSILSALVGIAIGRGHLAGVDAPIARYLPQYFGDSTDPRKRGITIGHLLSMRAGLETTSFYNYGRWVTSRNWVRYAIAQPLVAEPGGPMIYSTGNTHLLSAALARATGTSTLTFARRHLATPLGITLASWQRDPQGVHFGGNDMYLTPREMLRFGVLYLQRGRYAGRQVVPAAWVDSSFVPRTTSGWSGHQYGYGWWITRVAAHPVFFAWGYGGQFIFLVPSLGLVVVTTSDPEVRSREGEHLAAIHGLVADLVVGAAGEETVDR